MTSSRIGKSGLAALVVLAGVPALAMPRYTARYEQKCALCHVNPSGGGLRTTYATAQLVPQEIAWAPRRPQVLDEIAPHLSERLLVGADFREFWIRSDASSGAGDLNFFEMQADLYLGFQLGPRTTLYYDRGQSDSYELFGLAYPLPTLHVKAGRFVPSYGWKLDDHTAFVREELGFQPPANSDAGIEAGYSRGPLDVTLSLVNGNRGATMDFDSDLAQLANVSYRFRAGPVGASIGGSASRNPRPTGDLDSVGVYGYLTFDRLTWLGEIDVLRRRPPGQPERESLVSSHELTWLLRQGLELKVTFDSFDYDRDLGTGAKTRWGAGVFFMPRSYAAFEALVRRTTYDDGVAYSGEDATETLLQLHLLY